MTGKRNSVLHDRLPAYRYIYRYAFLLALFATTFLAITPAHAQRSTTPAFRVIITESYLGTQGLSAKPDDLSHPDHARFTITNSSELWYSVKVFASSDTLRPVAATPPND